MKNNYTTINKAVVIFLLTSLMGIGISIAQNNPPIAEDDTINYTAPITTIFESVLIANDNDPDGDPLAWDTLINVTGNGTVNWLFQVPQFLPSIIIYNGIQILFFPALTRCYMWSVTMARHHCVIPLIFLLLFHMIRPHFHIIVF